MLNRITIMGRITAEPVLRYTENQTQVVSFSVAVERDYKNDNNEREVDFINCVAWRNLAKFVKDFFDKGSQIVVSGRLQVRNWKDKNGDNRQTAEIVADNIYFAGSKKQESEPSESYTRKFMELSNDGDIPF